jgi:hypothetical protein
VFGTCVVMSILYHDFERGINRMTLALPCMLSSGEAEKEYWGLLRGNQDKYRENRGNRGRLV